MVEDVLWSIWILLSLGFLFFFLICGWVFLRYFLNWFFNSSRCFEFCFFCGWNLVYLKLINIFIFFVGFVIFFFVMFLNRWCILFKFIVWILEVILFMLYMLICNFCFFLLISVSLYLWDVNFLLIFLILIIDSWVFIFLSFFFLVFLFVMK